MDVTHIEACLSRTLDFIGKADTKANTQLTTCGILFAVICIPIAQNIPMAIPMALPSIVLACLSVLSISITILLNVLCVMPRLVPAKYVGSKIYFDTAENFECIEKGTIKRWYESASEEDYRDELIGQITENNRVAKKKYRILGWATKSLMVTAFLSSLFILSNMNIESKTNQITKSQVVEKTIE